MALMDNRQMNKEDLAKGRFIQKVLREEGENIRAASEEQMVGFSPETMAGRIFTVQGTELDYQHRLVHRFIDIRTRNTKKGKIKKKNYPIHNRPVYGVLNNIIRRISFGYSEAMKEEMMKLDNTDL